MNRELVKKAQEGCMQSYGALVSGIKEQAYRIAFCYLSQMVHDEQTGEYIISFINNKTVFDETGKPKISSEKVPLEKQDKYELTVEAKYTFREKVEIPFK